MMYIVLTMREYHLSACLVGCRCLRRCASPSAPPGTGGFGILNDSAASYSPYLQTVCTVFMLLFGVNFSCYYLLLLRQCKSVLAG